MPPPTPGSFFTGLLDKQFNLPKDTPWTQNGAKDTPAATAGAAAAGQGSFGGFKTALGQ